jgi:predicted histone-like DNA-binding protein
MQKYKVTSKKDTVKGKVKYMATAVTGKGYAIGNMELAKELSTGTSLNITDVLAIMEQLPEVITRHLSAGGKVHLKGFGFFQNSVKSDLADKPEAVTPDKVRFSKVVFKADSSLRDTVANNIRVERVICADFKNGESQHCD